MLHFNCKFISKSWEPLDHRSTQPSSLQPTVDIYLLEGTQMQMKTSKSHVPRSPSVAICNSPLCQAAPKHLAALGLLCLSHP